MAIRSILYLIAVILVFGWLLGFFWFGTGDYLIHILLILALGSATLGFFRKNDLD